MDAFRTVGKWYKSREKTKNCINKRVGFIGMEETYGS